jgi:tRNA(Ser,Leu) C12 N-acetylase TAN1
MRDWNIIVTVNELGYSRVRHFVEPFGEVNRTEFFNVLTIFVHDLKGFIIALQHEIDHDPTIMDALSRVVPVTTRFNFQSPEQFEQLARESVTPWIGTLAGHSFHVRMHRRGFKGRMSSQEEEQFLDRFILEQAMITGQPAHVDFDDPDLVIAVETIGQQAGLSIWSRNERHRMPFLKLD